MYEALGATDAAGAVDLLQVTPGATFERGYPPCTFRREPDDQQRWSRVRAALLAARSQRPGPSDDDKVVAAWNGPSAIRRPRLQWCSANRLGSARR